VTEDLSLVGCDVTVSCLAISVFVEKTFKNLKLKNLKTSKNFKRSFFPAVHNIRWRMVECCTHDMLLYRRVQHLHARGWCRDTERGRRGTVTVQDRDDRQP